MYLSLAPPSCLRRFDADPIKAKALLVLKYVKKKNSARVSHLFNLSTLRLPDWGILCLWITGFLRVVAKLLAVHGWLMTEEHASWCRALQETINHTHTCLGFCQRQIYTSARKSVTGKCIRTTSALSVFIFCYVAGKSRFSDCETYNNNCYNVSGCSHGHIVRAWLFTASVIKATGERDSVRLR